MNEKDLLRFWNQVDKTSECWLWQTWQDKDGYGKFKISGDAKRAHRLSYELYYGWIQKDLYVLHSCDITSCVNPHHLWQGTNKDNMNDMNTKDRHWKPKGELSPWVKLSEQQVLKIRSKYVPRMYTQKMLAEEYNVCQTTIHRIVVGKNWSHL